MARVTVESKKRIMWLFIIFLALMGIVILRLGYYQLYKGAEYREKAAEQQTRDQKVAASRGNIYDRNMKILAQSASCEDIMINPRQVQTAIKNQEKRRAQAKLDGESFDEEDITERIVTNLTRLLGVDEEWLRKEITLDYASRRVKLQVDQSVANEIRELKLPGVFFVKATKRYYPYSTFASHVIGFTGDEGNGLEGLEKTLNKTLSGEPGRIQVIQDVNNNATPYEYENYIAPENGKGVVLTIDEVLQHYVEKYLEEAYNLYDIRNGGAAILMDPNTGEILAMAVEPNFDLNNPGYLEDDAIAKLSGKYPEETAHYTPGDFMVKLRRNKAVVDSYEPGSTFKSIVAAAAIECGCVNPITDTFVCTGSRKVSVHTIHCHKRIGHGTETFTEAVENSCNPAFMEMGARMGYKRFRDFYEAFGFTDTTDFLLPGETKGIFFSEGNFNEAELATSSFGQGFQVTPLQMVTAFSAVVNGGTLMKPQLVKAYTDNEGNIIETIEPEIVREVISESTSRTMRATLESVVANGTGSGAYVEGYRIGGKTGTSEKQPRGQRKYVASFVGFAPADDPQLVCLLILDEPGGNLTGGGAIAAPAVGKILSDSLAYLGYAPQYSTQGEKVEVPQVVTMTTWDAEKLCKSAGLSVKIHGNGSIVTNQLPLAKSKIEKGGLVNLYTEAVEEIKVEVPDFTGKTKTEVESIAKEKGINITLKGGGAENNITDDMLAVSQSLESGVMVVQGSTVEVTFAVNDNEA